MHNSPHYISTWATQDGQQTVLAINGYYQTPLYDPAPSQYSDWTRNVLESFKGFYLAIEENSGCDSIPHDGR